MLNKKKGRISKQVIAQAAAMLRDNAIDGGAPSGPYADLNEDITNNCKIYK